MDADLTTRAEQLRNRQSFYASRCQGIEDRESYLLDGIADDAANDLDEALGIIHKLKAALTEVRRQQAQTERLAVDEAGRADHLEAELLAHLTETQQARESCEGHNTILEYNWRQAEAEVLRLRDGEEFCICAAVKTVEGKIVRGHRHSDALRTAGNKMGLAASEQGFITSAGRFVNRIEAAALQKAAGIKSVDPHRIDFPDALFSEDLY